MPQNLTVCFRSIKLGVIEDPSNRSRLAKLLRFQSSRGEVMTFLADYVARMKPNQNHIYYIAGSSRAEVTAYLINTICVTSYWLL